MSSLEKFRFLFEQVRNRSRFLIITACSWPFLCLFSLFLIQRSFHDYFFKNGGFILLLMLYLAGLSALLFSFYCMSAGLILRSETGKFSRPRRFLIGLIAFSAFYSFVAGMFLFVLPYFGFFPRPMLYLWSEHSYSYFEIPFCIGCHTPAVLGILCGIGCLLEACFVSKVHRSLAVAALIFSIDGAGLIWFFTSIVQLLSGFN